MLSVGQVNDVLQQVGLAGKVDPNKYTTRGDLEGTPGQQKLASELGGSYGQPVTSFSPASAPFSPASTPIPDFSAIVRQALEMQQQATQPAVAAIQASVPTTQAGFAQKRQTLEAEREPLKQRYQSILDELTRKEKVETESAQLRLAREYGKRGVPLSSGTYEQALGETTQPISQFYAGQARDVGLQREAGLRELTGQLGALPIEEQQSLNQINQAIATLQAGASKEGISNALNLLSMQRQTGYQSATLALQQRQLEEEVKRAAEEQAFKERTYKEVTLPESIYAREKPYDKSEAATTSTDLQELQKIFNPQPATTPPSFFKPLSTSYQRYYA